MEESLDQFILANFDTALSAGHIQVYYQPVIRTISGQLCSFEALARWIDPDRGMLPPDAFIPVLEQAKRIHRLDSFVIETVCRRIRQSVENNQTPIPVSINLSRMDFTHCDIFSVVDENARAFVELCVQSDAVRAILCGHVHGYHAMEFAPGKAQIIGSQGMAGAIDLVTVAGSAE